MTTDRNSCMTFVWNNYGALTCARWYFFFILTHHGSILTEDLFGLLYFSETILVSKVWLNTYWAPGLKFYMDPFDKTFFTKLLASLAERYIFFNYFTNCHLNFKIIKWIGIYNLCL
jgi:hypothetical protein